MKHLAIIAAAIAAIAATPAFAASSSSASLNNFQVTLIDLDPLDSIIPSIIWGSNNQSYNFSNVIGDVYDSRASNLQYFNVLGASAFDPISGSASTALSQSAASVTGSGSFNDSVSQANGSAQGNGTSYRAEAWATGYYAYNSYTLSANTLVIFSATASTHVTTTVGQDAFGSESAQALAQLYTFGSGPGTTSGGSQNSIDYLQSIASSVWNGVGYDGQDNFDTQLLQVTYTNLTGANKVGFFSAKDYVNGYSYIQAVPEPETYAMLLAGLGLVGFTARRRKMV